MMNEHAELVEEARDLARVFRGSLRASDVLKNLADAVESLTYDKDFYVGEARRFAGERDEANRAALAWQEGSKQAFRERDEARAYADSLENVLRHLAEGMENIGLGRSASRVRELLEVTQEQGR